MKRILFVVVLIVVVVGGFVYYREAGQSAKVVNGDNIVGCYVATLGKDVYSMKISSQNGELVEGMLSFKNFEKDSSSGAFKGTYKNGILLGDYSFQSEGMFSVMQVIFKKSGTGFKRGYGDMNTTGDRFADLNNIKYDSAYSYTYKASSLGCADIPPDRHADLIRVEEPAAGTKVASPLTVTGEARGIWYFEASFPIHLLDGNGKEIAVTPAQAQGEWMTAEFVPFKATLTFVKPTTTTGTLVLKKDNPSALPEYDDSISIPVRF